MPHVVTKATAAGSKGDLAKITRELEKIGVNILAIGGGEGKVGDQEFGVVAMILDPDDDTAKIEKALKDAGMAHVETFPNIHVEIPDRKGELKKVVENLTDFNILSVLSMGSILGAAHVGLGFSKDDHPKAEKKLKDKGILVHADDHTHPPAS